MVPSEGWFVVTALLFSPILVPAIQLVTMGVTIVSAYFVSRQQARTYGSTRNFLVLVHVFFLGVVVLEFFRNYFSSAGFIAVYTIGATSFILSDVVLLTLVAASFYYRQSLHGGGSPLRGLLRLRWHAILFVTFMLYIAFVEVYLLAFQPFVPEPITNIAGVTLAATVFVPTYVDLLFVVLVLFILYPSMLLFLSQRRATDKGVKRALLILPVCWSAIGLEFLIFNGYLLIEGIDASSLGYLIGAAVFLVTARIFRQATTISTLFATTAPVVTTGPSPQFSARLGVDQGFVEGRLILLESSAATNYEDIVKEFVKEMVSTSSSVFVFTWKGSPVYNAVSKEQGVRTYVFSSHVSYPKESENREEILVPTGDIPILLDVMSKVVSVNPGAKITIIYDNLSDVIVSLGLQECYKFVKQTNSILNQPNITCLFLMTQGAHDENTQNLIKSLFSNHLVLDEGGLRITRSMEKPSGQPQV